MDDSEKGIGLLGGSFDPVHNGHCSIVSSFLKSGFISEIWILLTPDPPHKTEIPITDYQIRIDMLQSAFRGMNRVLIKDIEKRLPRPSYTIRTLKYLKEKYPGQKFYLCIGGDSLKQFKSWHKWDEILGYCELLVAQRPSAEKVFPDDSIAAKTHYVVHHPMEVSSTEIRERVSKGKSISEFVPSAVEKLIKKYNLYR